MAEDLLVMARAAEKDERLSDGVLYGKLANEIERLREDHETVDRIWKALGITTYEQARGRAIWEIIAELCEPKWHNLANLHSLACARAVSWSLLYDESCNDWYVKICSAAVPERGEFKSHIFEFAIQRACDHLRKIGSQWMSNNCGQGKVGEGQGDVGMTDNHFLKPDNDLSLCIAEAYGGKWCVGRCNDPKDCSAKARPWRDCLACDVPGASCQWPNCDC
jgi:hypothetical protein